MENSNKSFLEWLIENNIPVYNKQNEPLKEAKIEFDSQTDNPFFVLYKDIEPKKELFKTAGWLTSIIP